MDIGELLEQAECYVIQLSQHKSLPVEIRNVIKDPLPGRQVIPWRHDLTTRSVLLSEASEDYD